MNAPIWKVSLSDTSLGEEEAQAAADVVRSGWLTQGERVAAFERAFASHHRAKHAIAVSNCTLALELALVAAGVTAGDEVIVPALTFVATANAARRIGAVPIFADVKSEDDLTLDADDVHKKITPRTKAVIPVHYAGYVADVHALNDSIASAKSQAIVIEDCAHSPGATLGDRFCGTLGAIGTFSFFANKNMTTGEGGMLTTESDTLAAQLRLQRAHGMTTGTLDRHRGHAFTYDVVMSATNARFDEIRAAIGAIQLRKLAGANARRAELTAIYRARLSSVKNLAIPFSRFDRGVPAHHLFVVLLPEGTDRAAVMGKLRERGVQSSIHYPPTHGFTAYQNSGAVVPVTERVAERLLSLPLYPSMSEAQQSLVCDALIEALE